MKSMNNFLDYFSIGFSGNRDGKSWSNLIFRGLDVHSLFWAIFNVGLIVDGARSLLSYHESSVKLN